MMAERNTAERLLTRLARGMGNHDERVERLDELTTERRMRSAPRFRDDVRPIFIVGAPRSGTSILTWVLGQHPEIQPMPETAWIAGMSAGLLVAYRIGSDRGRLSHLSNVQYPLEPFMRRFGEAVDAVVHDVYEERCRRMYGDYRASDQGPLKSAGPNPSMQIRRRVKDPKRRWVDGTPLNSHFIWPLSLMFPEARFIHSLRRPEEVVTSLESFATAGGEPQTLAGGIETWMRHTESCGLGQRALGVSRFLRVDFQRLQDEPKRLCDEILEFLGETPHPDCYEPLASRINTSQADDRLAATKERLQGMQAYHAALSLYDELAASDQDDTQDEEAAQILRRRSLERAADVSLL